MRQKPRNIHSCDRSNHVKVLALNHVPLFVTPMDCSSPGSSVHGILQERWSGLQFPSPGDLSEPGIKLRSPALQADSLPSEPPGKSIFNHIFLFFFSNFIFKLYIIVLVLPNIKMNLPQVYMCSHVNHIFLPNLLHFR